MTIGHSNRELAAFLDILRAARVEHLIDVRSFPRSRHNPAFNIDTLPNDLAALQIGYSHYRDLGGRRPKQTGIDERLNAMWRVQSFHNYADYALGDAFGIAFKTLLEQGETRRVALMCSETLWWRCHRRIITDYLLLNGHPVDHLMGADETEHASPTPFAQKFGQGKVIYPKPEWDQKSQSSSSVATALPMT